MKNVKSLNLGVHPNNQLPFFFSSLIGEPRFGFCAIFVLKIFQIVPNNEINNEAFWQTAVVSMEIHFFSTRQLNSNGWLLKFSLGVGFERIFIFSVTLDTRKKERQMSVSTIET
jgi:hypothetical protein